MAEICKPGDPVKWSTLYQLMHDIMDGAAGEYSAGKETNPDYNKTLDEKSPFSQEDVYQVSGALHIEVQGASASSVFLVEALGSTTPWDLPEPFATLVENDRLYLVTEEDGCWCKTIWKVVGGGGQYTLQKVDTALKMACQSIAVPEEGSSLPCEFVPQGAWARMQRKAYSARLKGGLNWTENKCLESGGLLYSTGGGNVRWVQRALDGYLTWTIAKDDFDEIYSAMYNVFTQWPCGFEKAKWWHNYDKDRVPGMGKMIQDDEALGLQHDYWPYVWAWTAKLLSQSDAAWADAAKPGCLELQITPYQSLNFPWETATCGDPKRCPDQSDKLLVRCSTLKVLDALVQRLKKTVVRTGCSGKLKYYGSFRQGFGQACGLGYTDDGSGYYTVGTATNSCSPDGGLTYQNCDIVETALGGVYAWGGLSPTPASPCSFETDNGCTGLGPCSSDPADFHYTKGGIGTASGVLAAAKGAAGTWIDGTGTEARISLGNDTIDGSPFYGGAPFVVGTYPYSEFSAPMGASVFSYRLMIVATDLPTGHVFRITVKEQRNSYDEFGNPTTELLSSKTVTIGPGATYQEEVPNENGVFLTAEIWHDKAPS